MHSLESNWVCSGPRPTWTWVCSVSFMLITGMPYGSVDSKRLFLIASMIFSKEYTDMWVSSLPFTTMNLPSGVTSTPCGLLGSGIRNRMPSLIAVSIMITRWLLMILTLLSSFAISAARFQLTTCM